MAHHPRHHAHLQRGRGLMVPTGRGDRFALGCSLPSSCIFPRGLRERQLNDPVRRHHRSKTSVLAFSIPEGLSGLLVGSLQATQNEQLLALTDHRLSQTSLAICQELQGPPQLVQRSSAQARAKHCQTPKSLRCRVQVSEPFGKCFRFPFLVHPLFFL